MIVARLSRRSRDELKGVHPDLVGVVEESILRLPQGYDFGVHDGIRTLAEQREYLRRGVSRTMNSKHLPQADGYGHAVDLVPYIMGRFRWEWEPIYVIAEVVRDVAKRRGVRIRWGGFWDELTATTEPPELLVKQYVAKRRKEGKKAFIDGPHYELIT
jgi:peptidoglycan L-alanyl-D-glutamate endopeptidase CwlK